MAQRRMIHEKMLSNASFGTLSANAKLLYIFCIVLADDDGRLKANAIALKGRVFAFQSDITEKEVRSYLNEIAKSRLVIWYKVDNEYFIQHPNWELYQILRSDRKKDSDLPSPDDNQMTTKRGRSKISKIREDKESKTISYLSEIPEPDIQEWLARFDVGRNKIKSKAEDFLLYCKSNAKWYADPKSALLNAMKKDFTEKKKTLQVHVPEPDRERVPIPQELKDQIRKITRGMKI